MPAKSIRQVIMRMTYPSRHGYVLNGEWTDQLATAVEEFVAEHYVSSSQLVCPHDPTCRPYPCSVADKSSSTVDGCPTCGGRWTRSGPPRKTHPDDQILDVNGQPALISGRDGSIQDATANCPDQWHENFFPQGRRSGY